MPSVSLLTINELTLQGATLKPNQHTAVRTTIRQDIEQGKTLAAEQLSASSPKKTRTEKMDSIAYASEHNTYTRRIALGEMLKEYYFRDREQLDQAVTTWHQIIDITTSNNQTPYEKADLIEKLLANKEKSPRSVLDKLIQQEDETTIPAQYIDALGIKYSERLTQQHLADRTDLLEQANHAVSCLIKRPTRVESIINLRRAIQASHPHLVPILAEFLTNNLESVQKKIRRKIDNNDIKACGAALQRLKLHQLVDTKVPHKIQDCIGFLSYGSLGKDAGFEFFVIKDENQAAIPLHVELHEEKDRVTQGPQSKVIIPTSDIREGTNHGSFSLRKRIAQALGTYKAKSKEINHQHLTKLSDELIASGKDTAKRALELISRLDQVNIEDQLRNDFSICTQEISDYQKIQSQFEKLQAEYMEELLLTQASMPAYTGIKWFIEEYTKVLIEKQGALKATLKTIKSHGLTNVFEQISKIARRKFSNDNAKSILKINDYYAERSLDAKISSIEKDIGIYGRISQYLKQQTPPTK